MGSLIVALAISDMFNSIVGILGLWPMTLGGEGDMPCITQAIMMYTANLSSAFLGFALAFNAWYIVVYKGSTSTLLQVQKPGLVLCFLVPVILALIPIFYSDHQFYGSADLWCWIKSSHDRLYYFYIFLWIVIFMNLITYIITFRELKKHKTSNSRKYVVQEMMFRLILAYSAALIVSWIPGTANRINDTTLLLPRFPFVIVQAAIAPARGFLDALAFWYTMKNQHKIRPTPLNVQSPVLIQSPLNSVTITVSPIEMQSITHRNGKNSLSSWLNEFSRESSLPSKGFDQMLSSFDREYISAPQSAVTSPGLTTAAGTSPYPTISAIPSLLSPNPSTLIQDSIDETSSSDSLLDHSKKPNL